MTKLLIENADELEVASTLIAEDLMDFDFEFYQEGRNVVIHFYDDMDAEKAFVEPLVDLGYYVVYYNRSKF